MSEQNRMTPRRAYIDAQMYYIRPVRISRASITYVLTKSGREAYLRKSGPYANNSNFVLSPNELRLLAGKGLTVKRTRKGLAQWDRKHSESLSSV